MESPILQMGNVVQNDPPIAERAPEQTEQTVFNMRHAVFLFDTVDEKLAKAFLIQARDPAFKGCMKPTYKKRRYASYDFVFMT